MHPRLPPPLPLAYMRKEGLDQVTSRRYLAVCSRTSYPKPQSSQEVQDLSLLPPQPHPLPPLSTARTPAPQGPKTAQDEGEKELEDLDLPPNPLIALLPPPPPLPLPLAQLSIQGEKKKDPPEHNVGIGNLSPSILLPCLLPLPLPALLTPQLPPLNLYHLLPRPLSTLYSRLIPRVRRTEREKDEGQRVRNESY